MDSIEDEEELLLATHRKQRKELQAEIQKLKKSVGKGDKKRKKEVTEEIVKLEADLKARQESELADLKAKAPSSKPTEEPDGGVCNEMTTLAVEGSENGMEEEESEEKSLYQVQKKSKAQIRREKQQTKDREREQRIKEQEMENRQGPRHKEMRAVAQMLKDKGLALHEIPADGNCMYNAIGHQLAIKDEKVTCDELRIKTASYMREHPDDFLPFLIHPGTDNIMTPEQFSAYCDKTAMSPVWGGHLELRALSEVLDHPIQVLQADVQPLLVGEGKNGPPLTLVYHRHAYRLGEHYNSVLPKLNDGDDNNENDDGDERYKPLTL